MAVGKDGEPHVTANEIDLVNYLEANAGDQVLHVNQNWNMKKWGGLVDRQLSQGMAVDPGTFTALIQERGLEHLNTVLTNAGINPNPQERLNIKAMVCDYFIQLFKSPPEHYSTAISPTQLYRSCSLKLSDKMGMENPSFAAKFKEIANAARGYVQQEVKMKAVAIAMMNKKHDSGSKVNEPAQELTHIARMRSGGSG